MTNTIETIVHEPWCTNHEGVSQDDGYCAHLLARTVEVWAFIENGGNGDSRAPFITSFRGSSDVRYEYQDEEHWTAAQAREFGRALLSGADELDRINAEVTA